MKSLRGEKILITGPAGQIAFPLASRLAADNEVWGIARFCDPRARERVEAAGIHTRVVDLGEPDWAGLPDDFSFVLHLAASIASGYDYDASLRVNAEGTGQLMSRFRNARACLVMSTCGVYASPADPYHAIVETDPLGGTPQPYSPTYCVSKIGEEAVARFAAREFELPTTIARMNVAYGDNGGYPAMLLEMILADQPIPLLSDRAAVCSLVHEDDIFDQTAGLLAAASIPAMMTNWGGDEAVDISGICHYMAELVGKRVEFVRTSDGIHQYRLDPTRRAELAGRCGVSWRDGLRRMITARHPELALCDSARGTPV
jgi:nucleoside-diphosphate-sugar epimerase